MARWQPLASIAVFFVALIFPSFGSRTAKNLVCGFHLHSRRSSHQSDLGSSSSPLWDLRQQRVPSVFKRENTGGDEGQGGASQIISEEESGRADHDRCLSRRQVVPTAALFLSGIALGPTNGAAKSVPGGGSLVKIVDPSTYPALAYEPPTSPSGEQRKPPLLVVLHGAGKNEEDVWNLANPNGEHAGLIPSLLATGGAPRELSENFAMVAPYSAGKRSFYEEPRGKLLEFVEWVCSNEGRKAGCPDVDPSKVFLFGFSDGATVGVELTTTRRFKACVFAAYGFTGTLPPLAVERLKGVPIWVFHSADDAIFPVKCSDNLVTTLRAANEKERGGIGGVIRYTRYDSDQEGFTGAVRGHSTGITASRQKEIYGWMLST